MKVEKSFFFLPPFFKEGQKIKTLTLFISALLLISASQLAFLDCQPFGCFHLKKVTWTQPCNCQFNHCLMPRIYNKEKQREFNFMSSFHLQKRSITVYKSQLYRIMWQDTWLMYCFEELRITLWEITHFFLFTIIWTPHSVSDILMHCFFPSELLWTNTFCWESKALKSDTTETKSILCKVQTRFPVCTPILKLVLWSQF